MKPEEPSRGKDPIFSQARSHDPDLHEAVRKARLEFAERATVAADLRSAEIARLEMLWAHLDPVFTQLPKDAELFDQGLIPGERPRLYVDMVAFVEMARDRRTYRFIQDTRAGRIMLAETSEMEVMADAVTSYIGRRLVQREAMIEADFLAQTTTEPSRATRDITTAALFSSQIVRSEPPQPTPSSTEQKRLDAFEQQMKDEFQAQQRIAAEPPSAATPEPQPVKQAEPQPEPAPAPQPMPEPVAKEQSVPRLEPVQAVATEPQRRTGEYGTAEIFISYCSGMVTGAIIIFFASWAMSGQWNTLLPVISR